jgi:hypothetical protein
MYGWIEWDEMGRRKEKQKTVHQDVDFLSLLFPSFLVRWLFEDWGEEERKKESLYCTVGFCFFFSEER